MTRNSTSRQRGAQPPAWSAIIGFLIVGSCGGVSLVGRDFAAVTKARKGAELARAQPRSAASAWEARGSLRQPAADALLDGGGEPWALFAPGAVPQEPPSDARSEVFVPADPDDPVGRRCCPGDTRGYWYYNVSSPTVVPFIVEEGHPHRVDAAVIVAPGGGNSFLAWNKEGTRIARWLNSIGYSAFVLKYRIPSEPFTAAYVKCLIDAQRAISLVRHRAPEFGLNTSRVGVIGFSAGGTLAAAVSYTRDRAYGPLDEVDANDHRPDFALLVYASGEPSMAQYAPPTFLAIANDDQCVPSWTAREYYAALQWRSSSHDELHIYAEGRHGYGDCTMYVEGYEWLDVCAWTIDARFFLRSRVLGVHPPLANLSGAQG